MRRHSRTLAIIILLSAFVSAANAQIGQDTTVKHSGWSFHFQTTVIGQKHSGFKSPYSGINSLADSVEPTAVSQTATLFIGRKLWKNATLIFNPEVTGGRGLSSASGVAGALNGETYRIGDPKPEVYIARAYLQQHFPLGKTSYTWQEDDVNQVAALVPDSRISIYAGKFSIADFFDDNAYAKDPRVQFFNWAMWANGAWDYPANTRGYTEGLAAEFVKPTYAIRISSVAVPRIANYHLMEYNRNAHSESIELQHQLHFGKRSGTIRLLGTGTWSKAPAYKDGINAVHNQDTFLLNVFRGLSENTTYGGHKYGVGINMDQELTQNLGFFCRIGWNDGQYASWAFTEIDRTLTAGLSMKGAPWKRPNDVCGIANAINGISKEHRDFLAAGGYGFIIGDGQLNYGHENILETFYNATITKFFQVSFDYQFVSHPGYNKDRGPVHVFALRGHIFL
ncbi:carbohydrate porin [Chitinophaga sp. Cy-1792]|uniref:carbohydrate porin n=1 Tax=Chitinophaga sp. Cy-1792 TaxID=2608339 RepID=UPI001421ECD7|nr:carbohydrate porin [Chitinophaga sp. Cy-1792]NIG55600.1 carbohydrate porin [Chitinophaga sp. Cy-1792]